MLKEVLSKGSSLRVSSLVSPSGRKYGLLGRVLAWGRIILPIVANSEVQRRRSGFGYLAETDRMEK